MTPPSSYKENGDWLMEVIAGFQSSSFSISKQEISAGKDPTA